jgi:hypothetical protein
LAKNLRNVSGPTFRFSSGSALKAKQAQLIAMLQASEGASIAEIVAATGWQSPTARGVIFGVLKKKLGLDVTSEKIDGRGRVYKIPEENP